MTQGDSVTPTCNCKILGAPNWCRVHNIERLAARLADPAYAAEVLERGMPIEQETHS